jgi:hypothetical protein
MYIVRDKKTKKILHVNPAPLSQQLKGKDIYFKFDPGKMEIGEIDGDLPEHFEIDKKGNIVELDLDEKVKAGIVKLEPGKKLKDGRIIDKTTSEKVADGLITLSPTQKIIGVGEDEQIIAKSRQEQLDEGLITLEEIKEEHIQRLRNETDAFLSRHKTTNGYQLDQLTRQKANFSYQFRHLPDTDENKKKLLEQRLIYPNHILDEIVTEIVKVQAAYDAAKQEISQAYENKEPVSVFESITISKYFPGDSK